MGWGRENNQDILLSNTRLKDAASERTFLVACYWKHHNVIVTYTLYETGKDLPFTKSLALIHDLIRTGKLEIIS